MQFERAFHGVARRARLRRDDGAVVAQKRIEKRTLARIGLAAEGDVDPLADAFSRAVLLQQRRERLLYFAKPRFDLFTRDGGKILFGVVDVGIDAGKTFFQDILKALRLPSQLFAV